MNNYTKREFKVQPINFRPNLYEDVTTIYQGENFIDVRYCQRKITCKIKKLSGTKYMNVKTGVIKEFLPMSEEEKRHSRKVSLKRTFQELQWLIRTNFTSGTQNQLFITLTYAQEGREMPTQEDVQKDFELFYKRLAYNLKDHNLEYIVVWEPQKTGWFHAHLMLKSTNQEKLVLPSATCKKLWRHGIVQVKRLKSDNVGAYYVAYFTDIISESDDEGRFNLPPFDLRKRKQKGARIHYYPKNFRLYRCSRGIERPKKDVDMFYELARDDGDYTVEHEKAYQISEFIVESDIDGKVISVGKDEEVNKIYRATFRKKDGTVGLSPRVPIVPELIPPTYEEYIKMTPEERYQQSNIFGEWDNLT